MHKKLLPPELLLLAQICTISFVDCGFAPDPTGGAYSAPTDPLAGLKGGVPRGKGGRGKTREGGEGKGQEGVQECPNAELASLYMGFSKNQLLDS